MNNKTISLQQDNNHKIKTLCEIIIKHTNQIDRLTSNNIALHAINEQLEKDKEKDKINIEKLMNEKMILNNIISLLKKDMQELKKL